VYCDYKDRKRQTTKNLISSLTCQFAEQYHKQYAKLPKEIKAFYDTHTEKKDPELKDHVSLLLSVVNHFGKAFVVIDALDECSDPDHRNEKFIDTLQELRKSVRMLVTSRCHSYIQERFKDADHVEIRANITDIRHFLESYMERSFRYNAPIFPDGELNKIIASLISEKCDGV
jgi:hypothetical protein